MKKFTNSSSTEVLHFSRFIRLIATLSLRGLQRAEVTTDVAPVPTKYM